MIKNEREIYTELQNVLGRYEELTCEDTMHVLMRFMALQVIAISDAVDIDWHETLQLLCNGIEIYTKHFAKDLDKG
jgi:hypothetical protein